MNGQIKHDRITASKQNLRRRAAQIQGWTLAANFACLQTVTSNVQDFYIN